MSQAFERVSFDQLVALVEGRVSPNEEAALLARVSLNAEDTATLVWLRRTIGLMQRDTGEDAPPEVIARARRIIRPIVPAAAPGLRERLRAVLRFDSSRQAAYGLRSAASATRQLVFDAGTHQIDLRLTPNGGQWRVAGQLLGPEQPGSVQLQGAAFQAEARLNEQTEFVLPPVPAGTYSLNIALANGEIAIENLELGE